MDFWNEKYAGEAYRFGVDPALFLSERAALFEAGQTALAVCDGEGRNSVWLAERGVDTVAFDGASNAVAKARRLAEARGVAVDFSVADVDGYPWAARRYDRVVAIFIQFAGPALRDRIFRGMLEALAPGGLLLLHGYTAQQLEYKTGGPPCAENFYDPELLRSAFAELEIQELRAYDRVISEGTGHHGMSALIDFVGRKPA